MSLATQNKEHRTLYTLPTNSRDDESNVDLRCMKPTSSPLLHLAVLDHATQDYTTILYYAILYYNIYYTKEQHTIREHDTTIHSIHYTLSTI